MLVFHVNLAFSPNDAADCSRSSLAAVKKVWGGRVTTIFPRQGHYALDEKLVSSLPAPDFTIARIGDLVNLDFHSLAEGGAMQAGAAD